MIMRSLHRREDPPNFYRGFTGEGLEKAIMICEPPKVASKALPRQRAHRMTTSRVCRTTHEEVALREPSGKKSSVSETYTNCIDLLIDVIIAAERACDESKTVESTLGEEEPQSHSSFPYSVADVDNLNIMARRGQRMW